MIGRNRRTRLLALTVFIFIAYVLWSKSSTTLEEARSIAEKAYKDATSGERVGGGAVLREKPKKDGQGATAGPAEKSPSEEQVLKPIGSQTVATSTEAPIFPVIDRTSTSGVSSPAPTTTAALSTKPTSPLSQELNSEGNPLNADDLRRPQNQLPPVPELPSVDYDENGLPVYGNEGRVEVALHSSTASPIHWTKTTTYNPLTSTIQLPTGSAKPIPKIQEIRLNNARGADEARLAVIKAATEHAWSAYHEQAWGHDEIMPISGKYKNPFNGWGATLVDSLDTLWIMNMTSYFEEAVAYVETIDFTTSPRSDIPLFETTIRYLGGLVAAYDISSSTKKYPVLLDKAVELAEVLYSAFDTPNRMPETFYRWKPTFSSNPHRAGSRVVLAELGSLSLEFTRLAQLTGEPKYYDAVARITDAFDEWQNNTRLPGMWPTQIDASGCAKPNQIGYQSTIDRMGNGPYQPTHDGSGSMMGASQPVQASREGEVVLSHEKVMVEEAKANRKLEANQQKFADDEWQRTEEARRQEELASGKVAPGGGSVKAAVTQGQPSKGRIQGFEDPIEEGSLDDTAAKAKLLNGETSQDASRNGVARSQPGLDRIRVVEEGSSKQKRQLDTSFSDSIEKAREHATKNSTRDTEKLAIPNPMGASMTGTEPCIPRGLGSCSKVGQETFTLGGMSDSTYEYLPKMHLLLGGKDAGREDQYRDMYVASADTAIDKLLYRPMNADSLDILVSGALRIVPNITTGEMIETFIAEGAHLTCFAGGMFALGGKIFDRPEDIEVGKKLTDGCVWAYNVTATGIMPEEFWAVKCDSKDTCKWNETKWYEELDPHQDSRTAVPKVLEKFVPNTSLMPTLSTTVGVQDSSTSTFAARKTEDVNLGPGVGEGLTKRQLGEAAYDEPKAPQPVSEPQAPQPASVPKAVGAGNAALRAEEEIIRAASDPNKPAQQGSFHPIWTPTPPLPHKEYVKKKIEDERLPPGFVRITSRKYILRPEAIESVFYMYRITGDQYWRDVGWNMFVAIQEHTRSMYGNSAIDDVTKAAPEPMDTMESFWIAETLKYFYLLFDEPERYSLDDWVLNTEAHFFKRPK